MSEISLGIHGDLFAKAEGGGCEHWPDLPQCLSLLDRRQIQTDNVHAVWRAGQGVHWILKDQSGLIRSIINGTGTIPSWVDYDTIGNLQPGSTPANGERLCFGGRFHIPELGRYENRRRFYDPQLGRLTQEEPVRFSGGGFKFYGYAYNHPTGMKDPTGSIAAANTANVVRIINMGKGHRKESQKYCRRTQTPMPDC
jgi:RHS repeat-associated protein